jgi:hypothetical protein
MCETPRCFQQAILNLYGSEEKVDQLFRAGYRRLFFGEHHSGERLMLESPLNEMQIITDFEILPEMAALLPLLHRTFYQFPETLGVPIFLGFIKSRISV